MRRGDAESQVDLRELGQSVRRGWWIIAVGGALGFLLGAAIAELVPQRYEGRATVLVRASPDLASSALSQLGGIAEVIGGGLGGVASSELDTELEILASRSVVGEVVDRLLLQAHVREPEATAALTLFDAVTVAPGTRVAQYEFEAAGDGYIVKGQRGHQEVAPGSTVRLTGAEVRLRAGELPERFTVELRDREDAIAAVQKTLIASSLTADVAEITYRAGDPETAARVPNLIITEYLERRRTTERGTNQNRYEFLVEHTDSVTQELAAAEGALRQYQETSGVLDPKLTGETQLTRAMELKAGLEDVDIEAEALRRMIAADRTGQIPPQELAAYPTFLRNPAINDVLARMLELETERLELRQRRTDRDDDVVALTQGIENLEVQLRSLSVAYLGGLGQQRQEIVRELDQYRGRLSALPRQAEESFRRQREVERLTTIQLALHSQLVQARLAAIGEGGEVRQIDTAVPPKTPAFPSSGFVLAFGLFGGLFFGAVGAVGRGLLGGRVEEPWEAEMLAGIRATRLGATAPVAFAEVWTARSLLLVPVGRKSQARAVGERIVETATVRGREAVLADLTAGVNPAIESERRAVAANAPAEAWEDGSPMKIDLPSGAVSLPLYRGGERELASRHRATLTHLEERFALVVAVVPSLDHPTALSLVSADRPIILVAGGNGVGREELSEAVEAVEHFGGRVAGIVLGRGSRRRN